MTFFQNILENRFIKLRPIVKVSNEGIWLHAVVAFGS
jgi:hypothetical protein